VGKPRQFKYGACLVLLYSYPSLVIRLWWGLAVIGSTDFSSGMSGSAAFPPCASRPGMSCFAKLGSSTSPRVLSTAIGACSHAATQLASVERLSSLTLAGDACKLSRPQYAFTGSLNWGSPLPRFAAMIFLRDCHFCRQEVIGAAFATGRDPVAGVH
jgi:hypothetical protein